MHLVDLKKGLIVKSFKAVGKKDKGAEQVHQAVSNESHVLEAFGSSLRIRNLADFQTQSTYLGHSSKITSLAFLHQSKAFISATSNEALVWNLNGEQNLGKFQSASRNLDCAKMKEEILQVSSQKSREDSQNVIVMSQTDIFVFNLALKSKD